MPMTDEQRWQWGVRHSDGSEGWVYNGRTSREHAEADVAKWPGTELVRRPVDSRGKWIGPPEPPPRQCAFTYDGERCRVWAAVGSDLCTSHRNLSPWTGGP